MHRPYPHLLPFPVVAAAATMGVAAVLFACSALASIATQAVPDQPVSVEQQEGPSTDRLGRIVHLKPDGPSRVAVGLAPHAQLFMLHRSHPAFSELFALLRSCAAEGSPVRLTVLAYSGRILTVVRNLPSTPVPTDPRARQR